MEVDLYFKADGWQQWLGKQNSETNTVYLMGKVE